MIRSVLVLVALVAVAVAAPPSECYYPCAPSFVAAPICGQQIVGVKYHTFSSQCALDCHAAVNPSRAYRAVSSKTLSCTELGHEEVFQPNDGPTEFEFPYTV